jgi:hypothetical protein
MVPLLSSTATAVYAFVAIGFAGFGRFNIVGTVAFFLWGIKLHLQA